MTAARQLGRRTYTVDRGFQREYIWMPAAFGGLMWVSHHDATVRVDFGGGNEKNVA